MKTALTIITALIIALLGIYNMQQPAHNLQQQSIDPQIDYFNINAECTKKLQAECALEIELTVKACSKAFETEGADIIADIKCLKDLMADKKTCWPCICAEAKKRGWHIIGC